MRYLLSSFVIATVGLLAMTAMAAESDGKDAKPSDEGAVRAGIREKILKEFDKDGDGKLSDDERQEARQKMRELMSERHRERGDDGERGEHRRHADGHDRDGRGPEGHGPDGHSGPDGHGGPDGPPKMPKPEEMFSKFDKDSDGKLSKDEFMALANFVHEHMPPPPQRPRFSADRGAEGPPRGHFEGHFEGRLEGRFVEGNIGPDGPPPRFRDGDGPGRRFHRPDGPPRDRDGDDEHEMRRHDGPPGGPGDRPGHDGDGPPRWRRFMERDGRRGPPPGDRDDDDDRRPPKRDRSDDKDKDKAVTAV
jgi:hypothetical protein